MNDFELKAKLRELRVPERPDEYWDDFPGRVRVLARRRLPTPEPRQLLPAWCAWVFRGAGLAATMAFIFICLQYHPWRVMTAAVEGDKHYLQSHLAKLDLGLHRLVLNTDGMTNMISEAGLN